MLYKSFFSYELHTCMELVEVKWYITVNKLILKLKVYDGENTFWSRLSNLVKILVEFGGGDNSDSGLSDDNAGDYDDEKEAKNQNQNEGRLFWTWSCNYAIYMYIVLFIFTH